LTIASNKFALAKYQGARSDLEKAQREEARSLGALEEKFSRLKELGCISLEQTKKLEKELEKEAEKLRAKLLKAVEEFEKKWQQKI
jgi:hypothetical protein